MLFATEWSQMVWKPCH